MRWFLVVFFSTYGGAHGYALFKARSALGLGGPATAALAVPLAVFAAGPVIVYWLARNGLETPARAAAIVGYGWMGLLFFFTWINFSLDLLNLLVRAVRAATGAEAAPLIAWGRRPFLAATALCVLLSGYAVFEAANLKPHHVRFATAKLPPGIRGFRIAQISDVHLGLVHRHAKAEAIARIVRDARPDLIVSTGDLVDGQLTHLDGLSGIFASLPAPLGRFAVTGNHEFFAGIGEATAFTRRAGFTLLRGDSVTLANGARLAGVDDPTSERISGEPLRSERDVLGGTPSPVFTLLLKHRPVAADEARGLFDLQLSGHTHHGQIFPFRYLTRLVFPNLGGLHPLPGDAALFVSRGTGTWGPPMRFLAPPEVTIIDVEGRAGP